METEDDFETDDLDDVSKSSQSDGEHNFFLLVVVSSAESELSDEPQSIPFNDGCDIGFRLGLLSSGTTPSRSFSSGSKPN
jgi:hypothetical protein